MLDWLKDIIRDAWHYLVPFIVIYKYERGVRLTFGKDPKVLLPGFHFKTPLIHDVHTCNVENDTRSTIPIHVTTTDERTVAAVPTFKFKIIDPIKWLTEANMPESNLHDIVRMEAQDYLSECSWLECKEKRTKTTIKNRVNKKIADLGVEVFDFGFSVLCIERLVITQMEHQQFVL